MAPDAAADNNILLHPWFPRTDPAMAGGSRSGEWLGRDQGTLGTIANSLVYEVASSRVNALPSPWSRALQFEQAVRNSRYPTREALLQELFGCFATLGLWEMFGLRLDAERVALAHLASTPDEAVGPFARSLLGTRPSGEHTLYATRDGSNPWDTLHVLKVEGVVVGFTSPATVICPAVHLSAGIPGMNWTADGCFGEPTRFLGAQQRKALADWIGHVRQGLLTAPDLSSQAMAGLMADVLNQFMRQLVSGPVGNATLSDNAVASLPTNPTAVALLRRAAKGGASPSQATVELGDRRQRPLAGTPRCPVILVDPEMPNRLGLSAYDIALYKSATLESVGFDKQQLERLYGNEIVALTPDDIFMAELFLLPGESALVNSWLPSRLEGKPMVNGSPVTPLLPLKERVRDLFSSEELAKRCTLRMVETGSGMELEVTLMLPLLRSRSAYPITRSFPIKEQNLIDEDLPVIAVWPNIPDTRWRSFYIFCEDRNTGLTVDGYSDYTLQTGREEKEKVKYFTSERFPDLIKVSERGTVCGLIPVNLPPPPGNSSSEWSVGFDFGTSFTNFFIDDGTGPARKLLETHVTLLTLAQAEIQLNLLNKFFVPENLFSRATKTPPTSTGLNTKGWQEVPGEVPEIYHQARVHWPNANALAEGWGGLRTGFKWHKRQYQKPFIKQLALLISSSAVSDGATEVTWSVSYPSAFSPNEAHSYRQTWRELCRELTQMTGMNHKLAEDSAGGGLQTEAVAFARYFGSQLNLPLVHTACLDVGGGTTDISIWEENQLIHQVSVPFAGRIICTQMLQANSTLRDLVFGKDHPFLMQQDANFSYWLDMVLRGVSDDFLVKRMPLYRTDSQSHKLFLEFVSLMAVSFGGLYHYLGLAMKSLALQGRLRKLAPVPVYIGGNGGRFLNWLDESGAFTRGCDTDQLLGALQRMSFGNSEQSGDFTTTLSNAFKDETACGLISQEVNLKGNLDPRDELMISGEELLVNGLRFGPMDRVAIPRELSTIESYELGSLTELRKFVRNYDESLNNLRINSLMPISKLTSIDALWDSVETQVRAFCLERVGKDVGDLEPEPGFITGLRALNTALTRKWLERN